ncbi:MAG: histidine--tRNA ligase [Halobacteriota archaeon]|nr:histidine--tRNA ligase [Halobacteriota archaeon]
MKLQRPRGTRDFLPDEMRRRRFVENVMRDISIRWGYEEVKTPTFESSELFTIKSGEGILEEIYSFKDKGGRDIALRPELTAPVMRMYVNELQVSPKPIKLFYFDNCFRYERPQKGRYREFFQFGVEIIGGKFPDADCEIIALASEIVKALGVKARLHIGDLGVIRGVLKCLPADTQNAVFRLVDKNDEAGLRELLKGKKELETLLEITRLNGPRSVISNAKDILSEDIASLDDLETLSDMLDIYGLDYTIDFGIARGLDYYNGVVFEIYSDELGAQNQICGGGSYALAALFGGNDVVSTGFAFGFDRTLEVCEIEAPKEPKVVVVATEDARDEAIKIALRLREEVPTYLDLMRKGFKAQLSYANTIGASFAVIIGKKELEAGKVTLKDMHSESQEMVNMDECIRRIVTSK